MNIKKYLLVAQNTIDEYLIYRLNFVMWRVRNVVRLLVVFFLWSAILHSRPSVFGYSESSMLTYILGISVIGSFVFATRTQDIGNDINEGILSNYLIRPMSYFGYVLGRDVADKIFNLCFAIGEFLLLFILLKPPLFVQMDVSPLLLTLGSIIIANTLYMLISILLGFIAFWSPETWGPRFIFFMLLDFFAGGLFPLDILPQPVYQALKLLPFNYLIYFPMKIYLGQLSMTEILIGLIISLVWIFSLWVVVKSVWTLGLKTYTAVGR